MGKFWKDDTIKKGTGELSSVVSLNSRKQGDIGVGEAINWFLKQGWTVSIPLSESPRYDLLVDNNKKIWLVQVKTCRVKNRSCKGYDVVLKTKGGNRSGRGKVNFIDGRVDYVFIYTFDGKKYFVPRKKISKNQGIITVGHTKWKNYEVEGK